MVPFVTDISAAEKPLTGSLNTAWNEIGPSTRGGNTANGDSSQAGGYVMRGPALFRPGVPPPVNMDKVVRDAMGPPSPGQEHVVDIIDDGESAYDDAESQGGNRGRFPTYRGLALIGDRGGEWAVNLVRQPVITITHDDGRSVYRREYGLNGVAHLPIARAWAYDQLQHLLNPLTGRVDRDRRQQTVQNLNAEVQQLLQILRAEVAPPAPLETRSRRPTQLFTVQPTEADAARMQRSMERWSPEYVATIMETRPFQDDSEDSDYEPGKKKGKKKQKKKRPSGGTAPGTSRSHAARRQLPAPAGTAGREENLHRMRCVLQNNALD
eukprot:jgi/Mesvir1/24128/Mv10845-RA.1